MEDSVCEKIKELFKQADTDNSGTISLDELKSVFSKIGKWSDEDFLDLFQWADQNQDGKLQYEEFLDWVMSNNPLMKAVEDGEGEAVAKCIELGMDVNSSGYSGPPLFQAVLSGSLEIAKILKEAGASLPSDFATESLRMSLNQGNVEMLKLLMQTGADPTMADPSLLFPAIDFCSLEAVQLLVEAKLDIEAIFHVNGCTPLHMACRQEGGQLASEGKVAIVDLLINAGANVQAINTHGETPLHEAFCNPGAVKLLIAAKVDLDTKADGKTAYKVCFNAVKQTVVAPYGSSGSDAWKEPIRAVMDLLKEAGADTSGEAEAVPDSEAVAKAYLVSAE